MLGLPQRAWLALLAASNGLWPAAVQSAGATPPADLVLTHAILALTDGGTAQDVAGTRVLETWFRGKRVYRAGKPAAL